VSRVTRVRSGHTQRMSITPQDPNEVLALHFDEQAVAADLALWCDGAVEESPDGSVAILVPGDRGPQRAQLGDWIVRKPAGDYYTCSPEAFAALHEPA
jgi:hypothetical protein